MTYNLCLILIQNGRMTADKLDVYFAAERLTAEAYSDLMERLTTV